MFEINDHILYGKTGVCKITDITVPNRGSFCTGRLCYVLQPMEDSCIIYAPVESKIPMRTVISSKEANRLIDMMPKINAEAYYNDRLQELTQHYQAAFDGMSCEDLVELLMSIYTKKKQAKEQNQKFGQIDGKFMKQAEDILYSEFSLALDIPKEKVPDYIESRANALNQEKEQTI